MEYLGLLQAPVSAQPDAVRELLSKVDLQGLLARLKEFDALSHLASGKAPAVLGLGALESQTLIALVEEAQALKQLKEWDHLFLAVNMPATVDAALKSTLEQATSNVLSVLTSTDIQQTWIERADELARAMVPLTLPDPQLVKERLLRRQTIQKILDNTAWVSAEQIHDAQLGSKPASKSLPASDWKRRKRIFSVNIDGRELFPEYQFDDAMRPLPIIAEILAEFGDVADNWKIASWFHFPNGWIVSNTPEGPIPLSPREALDRRDDVLQAVRKRAGTYVA